MDDSTSLVEAVRSLHARFDLIEQRLDGLTADVQRSAGHRNSSADVQDEQIDVDKEIQHMISPWAQGTRFHGRKGHVRRFSSSNSPPQSKASAQILARRSSLAAQEAAHHVFLRGYLVSALECHTVHCARSHNARSGIGRGRTEMVDLAPRGPVDSPMGCYHLAHAHLHGHHLSL